MAAHRQLLSLVALCAAVASLWIGPAASAREIKLAVTGAGGADQAQVRFMVMRLLRLTAEPPLDLSDALAVALAHQGRSRLTAAG